LAIVSRQGAPNQIFDLLVHRPALSLGDICDAVAKVIWQAN
jgi:hypothetical protein